jgi:hypothetical protein
VILQLIPIGYTPIIEGLGKAIRDILFGLEDVSITSLKAMSSCINEDQVIMTTKIVCRT